MKELQHYLPLIAVPAMLFTSCMNKQKQEVEKPLNIIHIMSDDHSYQTISAYNHPLGQLAPTPNIDKLAEKGMIFNRAYVENSLSTCSRACLFTGLYSHQNGQRTLQKGLDTTKVFFPELLQQKGYETGLIGKWHLKCEPKGFDSYTILDNQGEYYNPGFKTKGTNGDYVVEEGYATTLITQHALEFLDNRDTNKPFCLFVHNKAPHRNQMPDLKYTNLYEDVNFPMPETFYDDYSTRCEAARTQKMSVIKDMTYVFDLKLDEGKNNPKYSKQWGVKPWNSELDRMTPAQRKAWIDSYKPRNEEFIRKNLTGKELIEWKYQRYIKDYVRCIKSIDDQVGEIMAYLEKHDLMDNTIIVYTSDQGFYMGEHGWFDKRFMYEESFRTPLIVCCPSKIKANSVCDALVQNLDFAPTYLDLAGIEKPDYMEGVSLQPLFKGEQPKDWREYLYYHYYEYPLCHSVRKHDGVADGRYKLIHFYGKAISKGDSDLDCNELYDLEKDPHELNNVIGNPDYKDVENRLLKRLYKFRKDLKVDEY